jgi:site-specific recombinase XerD
LGWSEHKHRIYPVVEGIPSPYTQKAYQRSFERFLTYVKIHDLQVLLDFSPKVIKQMIVDYILYLRDEKPGKKLCRSSIKSHVSAILHFFQINNDDFNLTMKNFRIHLPSDELDGRSMDRPYTRDEIAQIIKDADIRTKVAIELLSSTGMRMGALHLLRIEDLTNWNIKV